MRNRLALCILLGVAACGGLQAATYVWDAEDPQLPAGADVAVVVEDGKIASMSVVSESDEDLVFTGDAMAFAADAQISLLMEGAGRLVFNTPVSSDGTISISNQNARVFEYDGAYIPASGNGTQKVIENMSISRVRLVSASFVTGGMRGVANPWFEERTSSSLSAQFQVREGGSSFTKCVKILFEQSGDDIVASIVYARYTPAVEPGTVDFDTLAPTADTRPGVGEYGNSSIAQGPDNSGNYGTGHLAFGIEGVSDAAVRFTEPIVGNLGIFTNVCVAVSGNALSSWQSVVSGEGGRLLFEGEALAAGPAQYGRDSSAMPTKTATLFAANQSIRDLMIETLTGKMTGASATGGSLGNTYVCFPTNVGNKASVWLQYMDNPNGPSTLKGVKLAFEQSGKDVNVYVETARYIMQTTGPYWFGTDLETEKDSKEQTAIAATTTAAGYGVGQFTVSFARAAAPVTVGLQDGCTLLGGTMCATGGVALVAAYRDSVPSNGTISVGAGADLVVTYTTPNTANGVGRGKTDIAVTSGGRLRSQGGEGSAFATSQKISCEDGLIEFGMGRNFDSWMYTYIQNLTLSGSSVHAGCGVKSIGFPRIGRDVLNPIIAVVGESPSIFESDLQLVGSGTASALTTLKFNVSDVTHDGTVDFVMNGRILNWPTASNTQQGPVAMQKMGGGTMSLSSPTTFGTSVKGSIIVSDGVLLLAASGVTYDQQYIRFEGGTLSTASGSTNVIGTLEAVTATSRIVLEDGSALVFAAADSAAEWTAGARLVVEGGLGAASSLRVGTTSSALSAAQRRSFRYRLPDSETLVPVAFDENGYAHPKMVGFTLQIR